MNQHCPRKWPHYRTETGAKRSQTKLCRKMPSWRWKQPSTSQSPNTNWPRRRSWKNHSWWAFSSEVLWRAAESLCHFFVSTDWPLMGECNSLLATNLKRYGKKLCKFFRIVSGRNARRSWERIVFLTWITEITTIQFSFGYRFHNVRHNCRKIIPYLYYLKIVFILSLFQKF